MRTKTGTVISTSNDKTIVVRADRYIKHPIYKKSYRVSKKFHAHDSGNLAVVGDMVLVSETRPISKLKNWSLQKIISKTAKAIVETPAAVESESEAELKNIAQVEKDKTIQKLNDDKKETNSTDSKEQLNKETEEETEKESKT
jgi:small subunit ribosomal protein S17